MTNDTTDSYTLCVHDGRAHMDDLVAAALYVIGRGQDPNQVLRLDSKEAVAQVTLAQPSMVFVDCGQRHEPERNCFDHHQDGSLPSAAQLVFDHFFPDLKNSELSHWIGWISAFDTRGPRILTELGVDREFYFKTNTGNDVLLKAFEHHPFETLRVFVFGMREKIDFENKLIGAKEWLNQNSRVVPHETGNLLEVLAPPDPAMSRAVKVAQNDIVDASEILAVYGYDSDQPELRTLFRTHWGDPLLDLTKSHPKTTVFCHNNGFFVKFQPSGPDEWLTLISQAS